MSGPPACPEALRSCSVPVQRCSGPSARRVPPSPTVPFERAFPPVPTDDALRCDVPPLGQASVATGLVELADHVQRAGLKRTPDHRCSSVAFDRPRTGAARCCIAWVSSWASRRAPSLVSGEGIRPRKKTSLPTVNARADSCSFRRRAAGPSWIRTDEKSAPNALSIFDRVRSGIGRPRPRARSTASLLDRSRSPPASPTAAARCTRASVTGRVGCVGVEAH